MDCIIHSHYMTDLYLVIYLVVSFTVIDAIVKDKFTVMYHALGHGLYNS